MSKQQTRWAGLGTRWSEIAYWRRNKTTAHQQDQL